LIAIRYVALVIIFCSIPSVNLHYAEEEVLTAEETYPRRLLLVPYPFFNDTIGAGLGVAAIAEGYVQPRTLSGPW